MGPYSIWDDDLPWDWGAAGIPRLPMPKAGKFYPDQPGAENWPRVPGYSCAHCGCLIGRARFRYIHMWNRSIFCRPMQFDFHLARPYQGE